MKNIVTVTAIADYGNLYWYFVNGILGSIGLILLACALSKLGMKEKVLTFVGQHSLCIFAIHQTIIALILEFFGNHGINIEKINLRIFMIALICFVCSLLIGAIIAKYVPILDGKFQVATNRRRYETDKRTGIGFDA